MPGSGRSPRAGWPIRWWLRAIAVAVAVPLLALLIWLFLSQVQRERAEARDAALRAARATAARMRNVHAASLEILDTLAARPEVRALDTTKCDPMLNVVDFFSRYADLVLLDREGHRICAAVPRDGEKVLALEAEQWIGEEVRRGRMPARKPVIRAIGTFWIAAVAVDVRDMTGKPSGYLAIVQHLDMIRPDALPPAAVVTVIDEEGMILARSDSPERWVGTSSRGTTVAGLALRTKEGRTEAVGVDGVSRQYGFTHLPEMGWYVAIGIPTSSVTNRARWMLVRGILGGVLIVAGVAGIALMLLRRLERPINDIAARASAVARGSYEKVPVTRGPREIVTMAEAFNEMVEKRENAERVMHESERTLKALSDRLLTVQEEERTRIAREIHDDLGQTLTAIKMDILGLIETTSGDARAEALRERLTRTIDVAVSAVQRISAELRPSILDDLGLVAAIEADAQLFEERTGIECELSLPEGGIDVQREIATALYRIAQEAMTNVARHSDATRVELRLRVYDEEVMLEVRDDGRGVTADEIDDPASLGLIGIRERAAIVGGDVEIAGVEGKGTIVSVRIPAAGKDTDDSDPDRR